MKQIVLGVFCNEFFDLKNKNKWDDWPFGSIDRSIEVILIKTTGSNLVDVIIKCAIRADRINFILDQISLPLDPERSVTCQELQGIIDNKLLKKTVFWLKGKRLRKDKVISLINKIKKNKLSFDNIDFSTI